MSDVLVDSSVWVDFLRGNSAAVRRVDPLITQDRVAVNGVVYAEILSGAPDRAAFQELKRGLRALGWLGPLADIWDLVAEARYALARTGFQAAVTDLIIAVEALEAEHSVLTRDRDFLRIRKVVPVEVELF